MVAAAFVWLGRRKNKRLMVLVLSLGLLMMLAAALSAMRGGEEYKGQLRTKSLVYENAGSGRMGLYWMDDKKNLSKATLEEVRRCEKLHPNEVIPTCQTSYLDKGENK